MSPSALRVGSVAKNVLLVGIGAAAGQVVVVLVAPVLARLYDPSAFGVLAAYIGLLSVLVAIASLRFDMAIPLASDSDEAIHLLILSVALGLMSSALVASIGFLFGPGFLATVGATQLAPYLWIVPIALAVASVAQAASAWAIYHRMFGVLARIRVTQGFGQATSQVVLGIVMGGPSALIAGDIVGRLGGVEQVAGTIVRSFHNVKFSASATAAYAQRRWLFARTMTLASLANALSLQIPFLFVPLLFDLDTAGQYFLAFRILVLPAALVATAVAQVFFGEASFRRSDQARLHSLAKNMTVTLLAFSIPTYGLLSVSGQGLVTTIFGARWDTAGAYAQVMAPSLIFWAAASPISSLLLVGEREHESVRFTVAELALRTGALLTGGIARSMIVSVAALSVVTVLLNIAALWRFLRVASVDLRELAGPAARIAGVTAPFVALLVVIGNVMPVALPTAAAISWAVSVGLSAVLLAEPRLFVSGSHD